MTNNDQNNVRLPFSIENNILKGRVAPFQSQYTHVGQLLFDSLKKNADLVGQVDAITGIEDTFGDILDMSIKCALWMQKQGVKSNDIIVISSQCNREFFVPAIAALFIGAIFSPWDDEKDTDTSRHYIKLLEPKVVFANKKSSPVVLKAAELEDHQIKVVVFENCPGTTPFADILKGHSKCSVANFQCTEINENDHTAMIMFSSGTTGLPKGITITHRSLLAIVESWLGPPVHTCMWYSCLFWLSGPLFNMRNIIFHNKKIIPPPFEEESACRIIQKYKVEWLLMNTTKINRLVRYNRLHEYDFSSLKALYIAGSPMEKLAQNLVKKCFPNTDVIQLYGMAEMGNQIAGQLVSSPSGSSGLVARNCEVKIIDPKTGKTLGPNQKGEICGKSIAMMSGYYKNPEATKKVIDEDGWLHTGDFGYYTEEGELFVVDRLSDLIKFSDHLIIPSEIEAVLLTHPSVLEVAVIGIPHPTDGEHPLAFVRIVPNEEVSAEELIDLVASKLPDHCRLRGGVIFLPSFPYTPTGKILKKELKMLKTKSINERTR
ncbi:4-coumarate--CoA ligase 1-like [Osmia bicornis bicornis]|uniref:4-coumarate--CoA ligase 1-like n=1 Tax=Osmia bicornis bicornis TaxID=1437191 RepID=UPI001EAF7544|nr:4-coumarate--CoA ligase 1-like [Osmia bicornis bicornis]